MVRVTLLMLPIALAGCQQQRPLEETQSVGAQNDARAKAIAEWHDRDEFMPGKWETKQDIGGVAKADLPSDSKAEIAKASASIDQCMPPEESRQPDANFFAGGDESECKYTRFSMRQGKLEAAISCTLTPGTMTMALKGTYTPTSYTLDAAATTSGTGAAPISTSAKLSGTWLEACTDPQAQRQPDKLTLDRATEEAPQPPAQAAGR